MDLNHERACLFSLLLTPIQETPQENDCGTHLLTKLLVEHVPHKDGISQYLSPCPIITRQDIDYNKHCKLEFREHIHTHEQHDNSMECALSVPLPFTQLVIHKVVSISTA